METDVNGLRQMHVVMSNNISGKIKFLIIFYFLIFFNLYQSQLVVCETVQTSGYNLKGESAYLQKISKEIQYGCGATWGKEIFYKNMHSNKVIKGFILKKWKYNNGYEIYDVCEIQHFKLKPGEQSRSFGCDHITQTQPAEFIPWGKFL